MFQVLARVTGNKKVAENIFLLEFDAPAIAAAINPGQFLNIKVNESLFPLLRRPFSVCDVNNDRISVMFNVMGEGTRILSTKKENDFIDILGPLGHGFSLSFPEKTAIIIAGGLGAAPFPYLTKKLSIKKKGIFTFVGGRSSKDIINYGMENVFVATEDGSEGFHGNVIQCLENNIDKFQDTTFRVFTCGPNAMMRALKEHFKRKIDVDRLVVEASVESAMACGFGICQGCPIDHSAIQDVYKLICKDGPVFNLGEITL